MGLVKDKMEKSDSSFGKAVPLEIQVAVALWRLANPGSSYCKTSKVFGVGLSNVAKIMYEFCEATLEISHEFVQLQFKSFVHLLRVKYHKLLMLMMTLRLKYYVWSRKV